MDLAKIRKKAKSQPKTGAQDPASPVRKSARESASVQATPNGAELRVEAPQLCVEPDVSPKSQVATVNGVETGAVHDAGGGKALPLSRVNPLDELFRQTPDIQLATEDSYLRALTDVHSVDENVRQWLTFSLADEEYALNIETIDEICKPREVTEVPNAPSFVLGLISLRGKIVPVYDLRSRLQLGAVEATAATRIIVCQTENKIVGLLVDSITQVVRLADDEIEPPPMVLSGLDRDMLDGVGRSQDRMIILLNLNNVITIDRD
ncbi:MAG: chemotaxis protein CheW [Desulfuromonadaceae bacterium]|nr:chemotaxis protein CheW [Desulfuromonadaceae bacterium]